MHMQRRPTGVDSTVCFPLLAQNGSSGLSTSLLELPPFLKRFSQRTEIGVKVIEFYIVLKSNPQQRAI